MREYLFSLRGHPKHGRCLGHEWITAPNLATARKQAKQRAKELAVYSMRYETRYREVTNA